MLRPWNRMLGYEGSVWCAYFWFVGWANLSLGFHVCLSAPNIEIHLPFGFVRLGRKERVAREFSVGAGWQCFGSYRVKKKVVEDDPPRPRLPQVHRSSA